MAASACQIQGAVQNYSWGKVGNRSAVAKLCRKSQVEAVDESKPYAELWMGTHSKAPSVLMSGRTLTEFIDANQDVLGEEVCKRFGSLPFLFKVLSVAKSLSIQAHPDKKLAERLHAEQPEIYKDPNHKPEMAIALTKFEALCGFRPLDEILKFVDAVPELQSVIGEKAIDLLRQESRKPGASLSTALKECFSNLILCEESVRYKFLVQLVDRVKKMVENGDDTSKVNGDLLLRLNSNFPGDVGCFVVYFLNHVFLEPGEALFLAANVPHAYLSGDCIECMACSDNVVRAGLTPKLVDAATLCSMLEYRPSSVEQQKFKPNTTDDCCELLYNPPVDDFAVIEVKVPVTFVTYAFRKYDSASILLFISGKATVKDLDVEVEPGLILFVPCGSSLVLEKVNQEVIAYQATCIL